MSGSQDTEFSRLRGLLWPVHNHELKKLIPLLIIAFLISFNYNLLRPLKDTVIMKAPGSGAEVIPFAKVWVMLPMAVAVSALFAFLSRHMTRERVFYTLMGIFLGSYTVFAFIVLPNAESIHANSTADWLATQLPEGAKGLVMIVRYWSFAVFYAMCELWSPAIYFLLFWSFVNEITQVVQAKRFYGILGIGSHLSGVFAGETGNNIAQANDDLAAVVTLLVQLTLVSGILIIALFRWMHTHVLTDPRLYDPERAQARRTQKLKVSFTESILYLARSPYMRNLAIIVLTYNVVINLSEVVWKDQVSALYPDENEFHAYMCRVTTILGLAATGAALFFTGNFIRLLGWTTTAMITPVVLLLTTILFFGALFFPELTSGLLPTIVLLGTTQNVLSRGAKYTVYDATKELAFTPLCDASKLKGKTAIDGVGSRLGKSGGAAVHQFLLVICGGLASSFPYVGLAIIVLIVFWIIAVSRVGTGFSALTEKGMTEEAADAAIRDHGRKPVAAAPQTA